MKIICFIFLFVFARGSWPCALAQSVNNPVKKPVVLVAENCKTHKQIKLSPHQWIHFKLNDSRQFIKARILEFTDSTITVKSDSQTTTSVLRFNQIAKLKVSPKLSTCILPITGYVMATGLGSSVSDFGASAAVVLPPLVMLELNTKINLKDKWWLRTISDSMPTKNDDIVADY